MGVVQQKCDEEADDRRAYTRDDKSAVCVLKMGSKGCVSVSQMQESVYVLEVCTCRKTLVEENGVSVVLGKKADGLNHVQ